MMGTNKNLAGLLDFLSALASGSFTITANGFPMLRAEAETKSLLADAKGIKESGIHLSRIFAEESGIKGMFEEIRGSEAIANDLSDRGWTVSLYDGREKLLTMGRGASSLTGHIQANPMKLKKIFEALG